MVLFRRCVHFKLKNYNIGKKSGLHLMTIHKFISLNIHIMYSILCVKHIFIKTQFCLSLWIRPVTENDLKKIKCTITAIEHRLGAINAFKTEQKLMLLWHYSEPKRKTILFVKHPHKTSTHASSTLRDECMNRNEWSSIAMSEAQKWWVKVNSDEWNLIGMRLAQEEWVKLNWNEWSWIGISVL